MYHQSHWTLASVFQYRVGKTRLTVVRMKNNIVINKLFHVPRTLNLLLPNPVHDQKGRSYSYIRVRKQKCYLKYLIPSENHQSHNSEIRS